MRRSVGRARFRARASLNDASAGRSRSCPTSADGGAMGSAEDPGRSFVFSFGLEKLGLVALRAPYVMAALIVIATILGAMGVAKLQVDDSLSELFRTNTEEFHRYEAIDRRFPSSEYDVLVVVEGKDLLQRKGLEAFANLTT